LQPSVTGTLFASPL
jgi:hypothetical protein